MQARLRLANSVAKDDILEAVRLMEMSKDSLRAELYQKARNQKPVDQIFAVVRELLAALPRDQEPEVSIDDAWAKAESKGNKCTGWSESLHFFMVLLCRTLTTDIDIKACSKGSSMKNQL